MKKSLYTFFAIYILFSSNIIAQDKPLVPKAVGYGVFLGKTPPLKDLPAVTPEEIEFLKDKALKKAARKVIKPREYPFAATALPRGEDAAWQKTMGKTVLDKAPLVNFEGQTTSSFPPDCNGTIGPNHYMQTVNTTYAIYNRSGTLLAGPTNMNLLFNGVSGTNCNDGDPLIQYDEQAQRWVAVEFSLCGSNDLMLMAVSATSDPTGSWYAYSFDVTDTPDYEKLGIWQDGYYMGTNTGTGNDIYVFERAVMMAGGANPKMVAFDNAWRPGSGFLCVPPLDNDGAFAPAGSPGLFIAFNDDAVAGGSDQLWIYQLAVNWTTPASSTFVRSQQIPVTAFDSQFTSSWDDITQPGTQKLDGVPQVIMNAPQYRNFGTYQTILCCHTVDVDATNHAGIRWYELRKTPPSTTWVVRQSGTYAPDASSRWMGSIMLNGNGKIGLAYSIASSTIYPGIRYCGQSSAAYANATGVLDIPEEIIQNGTVSQTTYNRWGDYALLSVDPTDDNTFWFSSEYVKSGGSTKGTKIASFRFGNNPVATTLAASAVTATSATLNGSLNPNGLATTYYFQWGTTVSYGNTTSSLSAGSGSAVVAVNANISGLIAGTTYHFRLVAVNADGTTNGNDLTFAVGVPTLTTVAATTITTTTAVSGGNITSDGGSTITARGVCWSTTLNPTTANNKTTNGSGTGSFSSSITGLSANTTYHVRAYATNSSGTSYGDDIQFSTLCGTISTFPWNEGFENAGAIPACWSQEQVNSSGINWTFVAGNGGSNPAAAHTGSYNATLKDASTTDNITKLITPTLNLTSINNPQLSFWHTQQFWSPDQDLLSVYYKTSATGIWTLLTSYTNSITAWTQENIALPTPTSDYYIAFEGNAKWGYGICVDDVSVTGTGCIVPSAAGAISGTTSVCQGQTITYTVSPIANATSYVWTLPNGVSGTSSTNSINVNYGISAISGNITVKGNNICGDGSASSLVVTVNSLPDAAGIISGNTSVCSGQIINYSVSPIANATSYVWTLPNGASGSSATNSIDVSFSISATSGNITVKANNACGDGSASTLPIVVGILPSAAAAITGTASVCQGQTLTYTVTPIANATSYVWTLPAGANGTSTTNSIDVNFDLTSASGNINVKGNNACGNGSASDLAITVNSLPDAAGIISGNETVCKGQSLTYSVGAIANAASYTWNLPSGVSGNSVTNNIDVSYGVVAISGNISVNGSNICGDGSTSSLAVTVKNIPASANSISGLDTINQGQNNVIYSVSPIIDANTYIWTLPTNSVGNSVSSSIVLSFPDSSVSGNLIVKGQNECGVGEPSSKFINVFKSLEVKLFLEGLYIGNQQMQSALDETGTPQWGAGNADKIIIELRDSSLNFQSVFTDSNILLKTDGYAFNARITASNKGKYYIVAKNRNHIETWSAAPVSFSNDTTYYNFTTSADKAFGNNLKETAPDYVINLTAILADNTNNILELKSYAYKPLRYTLILLPESDNIHLKVIVIDKVLNKTYQTSVLKSDYLY